MAVPMDKWLTVAAGLLIFCIIFNRTNADVAPGSNDAPHRRFEYKYSFKGPHLSQSDGTIPFWLHNGNAIPSADQAIWFTSDQGLEGPVFGAADSWNGLGIFFDSFDNDAKKNNPAVLIVGNNGKLVYDHQNDGSTQALGSCLRDFRNKPYPVRAKITYYKKSLTVWINNGFTPDKEDYEFCAKVDNMIIPAEGFFGISAATGGLADDHDVLSFLTFRLTEPGQQELQYFISAEDNYESVNDREVRQIFEGQRRIHLEIKQLNRQLDMILDEQRRYVTAVTDEITKRGALTPGQPGQVPTEELDSLVKAQQEVLRNVNDMSMVSSQVKNLGLGGGEEEKKDDGAAADPAAAAGMTREEYEEYQKQVVEEKKYYLSARTVINIGASVLGATLQRFVLSASALGDSVLDASALGARHSVHFHRCTHLLCSTLGAQYSMLQCSTLGARRSALGVRHFSARRSVLGAWRSALGARTSMLRRSALQHSMLGAWCIDATRARTSTFDALRSMLGACEGPTIGLCGVSGPRARCIRLSGQDILWLVCGVPNPHPLPEGKVGSWWAFTLLGAFHTASAPPLSTVTPPVRRLLSRSPSSQLTAGQRYLPRHVRECSRSPAARDPSPHRKRPRWESRSCSRSPHQKGRSRSPRRDRRYRDRSGVAELTSKMSQFMEVMMGQQSLLMSLVNVVPPVSHQLPQSTSQLVTLPQPIPVPVPQVQECDVDAVSRDASDGEPLLEEDSAEAELTSQPSEQDVELVLMDTNDPMWSLVERATRHLGVEWPMVEQPRRSLFESPSAQPRQSRMLPAFADFIKVQSTWGTLASAPVTSHKASTFNMQGATDARLASFPPVRRFGEDANAVRTDKGSCMSQQAMQNHRGTPQKGIHCSHRGGQAI
ncbi:UNVERIFIED_CONTAM: hypothetical protein FKN15_017352 [Acipenser sinensis]